MIRADNIATRTGGGPRGFDEATSLRPVGPGEFGVDLDPGWNVQRGLNGGYVAAVLTRAAMSMLTARSAARAPRTLGIQFLAPPQPGPARIFATVEQAGRLITQVSLRLEQRGRIMSTAAMSLTEPLGPLAFCDLDAPDVPLPRDLPEVRLPVVSQVQERYELRWATGAPPLSGADSGRIQGWIRLRSGQRAHRRLDAPLLAAFADGWFPPVLSRLDAMARLATIEMSVHFLVPALTVSWGWVLIDLDCRVAAGGLAVTDADLWANGTLIARTRQSIAVLGPYSGSTSPVS